MILRLLGLTQCQCVIDRRTDVYTPLTAKSRMCIAGAREKLINLWIPNWKFTWTVGIAVGYSHVNSCINWLSASIRCYRRGEQSIILWFIRESLSWFDRSNLFAWRIRVYLVHCVKYRSVATWVLWLLPVDRLGGLNTMVCEIGC